MRLVPVITTTWSFRQVVFPLNVYPDSFPRLLVKVGNSSKCLVTEVDMGASSVTRVAVATMSVLFASVARVVHWARIRYPHDDASSLRSTIAPSVVIASDFELLSAHRSRARWSHPPRAFIPTAAVYAASSPIITAVRLAASASADISLPEGGSIGWGTAVAIVLSIANAPASLCRRVMRRCATPSCSGDTKKQGSC